MSRWLWLAGAVALIVFVKFQPEVALAWFSGLSISWLVATFFGGG